MFRAFEIPRSTTCRIVPVEDIRRSALEKITFTRTIRTSRSRRPSGSTYRSGLFLEYAYLFHVCGASGSADLAGSTDKNRPHIGA